jgi:hypothetical protein
MFNIAREADYAALLNSMETLSRRIRSTREEKRLSEAVWKSLSKELRDISEAYSEVERIDFFDIPLKRKVTSMIERSRKDLESPGSPGAASPPVKRYDRKDFLGKTWATRKRIHIDRLCSAWLIKRFIDAKAKFIFAPESKLPPNAIPFDVFGVEFSHHAEDCTFETLVKAFRISDKGLKSLSQIIHDIDMKDGKFGRPEAAGLDAVVRSLSDSMKDDHKVLEVGFVILDALYSRLSSNNAIK